MPHEPDASVTVKVGTAQLQAQLESALVSIPGFDACGLDRRVLAHEASFAAEPALALSRASDLSGGFRELAKLPGDERSALLALLGGSGHLSRVLRNDPGWRSWLLSAVAGQDLAPNIDVDGLTTSSGGDPTARAAALRAYRQRAFLRIGARQLWGLATVDEIMADLSTTAEIAITAATRFARHELEQEYGSLRLASGQPNRFVVLGMGKLGAGELNYSSDVDLVFVYENDGTPSDGGPRGALPPREYFTRLAERVTRLLSEVTDQGFVFRVDLRLRPDGMNGPLVNSFASTLTYYEAFGQTWERAALFKARAVGGDLELGRELLCELAPFIYRRTLDYTMIADLEAMKARVEEQVSRVRDSRHHVKLGPGGIREAEFLVQSFAMVHGGREKGLRERGTLKAIPLLVERQWLRPDEADELAAAYRWLRRVEHALQIDEDRQIHTLPADPEGREVIARRLGLHLEGQGAIWLRTLAGRALEKFEEAHTRHTGVVQRSFEELFRKRREQTMGAGDRAVRVLVDELDAPDAVARIRELGFSDPEGAIVALKLIRDGPAPARASAERRRLVRHLAPALLEAARGSVAPDRALARLSEFITRIGARRTFLSLLAENPATLRLLIDLFATSEYLSRVLIGHPELIDTLVRSDLALVSKNRAKLERELGDALDRCADFEERLDTLRRFRNDEFLRIGIHDIVGNLHYGEVSTQLSHLAEACLGQGYRIALDERRARYGSPAGLDLAVIAMGKLGGGELNYHSDLDLIFVYGPVGAPTHDGCVLAPQEYFAKVAQLLMLVLQLATREGYVYKIDTRLRPSGRSGPLVTSLEGFARYHTESSAVWERQALVRARVVCGPEALHREIESIIERFVYGRGLLPNELAEIARLRGRMEHELAREDRTSFNLKTGRGGLVDIEFVAQALALAHGHRDSSLRQRSTRELLRALGEARLLDPADYAALADAYQFLRGLENRLRIEGDQPIERIPRDPQALAATARRMGITEPGSEAGVRLLAEYERRRERVREIYHRRVGRALEESGGRESLDLA